MSLVPNKEMTDKPLVVRRVLAAAGIIPTPSARLDNRRIERSVLLSGGVLTALRDGVEGHRSMFSSSTLSFLHSNAGTRQRWPGLNGVRQLLASIGFCMVPGRTSAGYDSRRRKKYKRHFVIKPRRPQSVSPVSLVATRFVNSVVTCALEGIIDYYRQTAEGTTDGAPWCSSGEGGSHCEPSGGEDMVCPSE